MALSNVRHVIESTATRPRSAVEFAWPQRLVRLFLAIELDRVASILQRMVTVGVAPTDEFVRNVLARLAREQPTPEPEPLYVSNRREAVQRGREFPLIT